MLLSLLGLALASASTDDSDDPGPRVSIGESAADEDEAAAPTGLPPEEQRRGASVDDEPESQETG